MAYEINYNDQKFKDVEADKQAALNKVNSTYDNMISQSDQYYDNQIQAAKDYATTQSEIQQQKTDQLIEEINQQKEKTTKDYLKEQSGAYVDWQKQTNDYGVKAEEMASKGMTNTGYSETSEVSMYNTYQNRVATAKESYNNAILNYDNSIKQAILQNNSILAEIAYNALQKQLELSLAGFQAKNSYITQQLEAQLQLDDTYYNRWLDVLNQMNTENALAEQVRQFNKSYSSGGGGGGSYYSSGGSSSGGSLSGKSGTSIASAITAVGKAAKATASSTSTKKSSSGNFWSNLKNTAKKAAKSKTKNKSSSKKKNR